MKRIFKFLIIGFIFFMFLGCPLIENFSYNDIYAISEISNERVKVQEEINLCVKLYKAHGPVNVLYYNLPEGYQYIDCERKNEFILTEDKRIDYSIPRGYENTTLTILRGYDDAKDYKTEISFSYNEPGEYKVLIRCLRFYKEYIITVTE